MFLENTDNLETLPFDVASALDLAKVVPEVAVGSKSCLKYIYIYHRILTYITSVYNTSKEKNPGPLRPTKR